MTWIRTNDFASQRGFSVTGGKAKSLNLHGHIKQWLAADALCLIENEHETLIICHIDDVRDVEKALGMEDRDIYAEKVDHVLAWLKTKSCGNQVADDRILLAMAKDLIAAGFEAGFKP